MTPSTRRPRPITGETTARRSTRTSGPESRRSPDTAWALRPFAEQLDEPLADRVRDGVRPVPQLQARRHVVDDVLDRSLRVEELLADFRRVEALGQQPQDLRLALAQPEERQPARRQHLALELADLAEQPPEQVRRQRSLTRPR